MTEQQPASPEMETKLADLARANARLKRELARSRKAEVDSLEFSRRLVAGQEAERRQVGRELHDDVGGLLTAVKLSLTRIKRQQAGLPADIQPLVAGIDEMLLQTIEKVRSLSHELRPGMLDDLGLVHALLSYFDGYTPRTHVRVTFSHNQADERLPSELETALFRIVQEALTNVAKHAAVNEVTVRLERTSDGLCLTVADHGKGFDIKATRDKPGGLANMADRARALGGESVITSSPGAGTLLTSRFPLPRQRRRATR